MTPDAHTQIIAQVKAIQEGFEKRAAANTSIATALRELTVARVASASTPAEAHAALNSYVEGMMHW